MGIKIAIDATNIGSGGGINHLVEIINNAQPQKFGIDLICIWASDEIIRKLIKVDWLTCYEVRFNSHLKFLRFFWRLLYLSYKFKSFDVCYLPGATIVIHSCTISFAQNLLPFDNRTLNKYKFSISFFRFRLLRLTQSISFYFSKGIVFLTEGSKKIISDKALIKNQMNSIIPHGYNKKVFLRKTSYKTTSSNFKVLYVSTIDLYKNHDIIIKALSNLQGKGYSIEATFIGSKTNRGMNYLNKVLSQYKNICEYIKFTGAISNDLLSDYYSNSDCVVYASSCETFGIILLESMGMGMPIVCSSEDSLKETLKDGGLYFFHDNVYSLEVALMKIIDDEAFRTSLGLKSFEISHNYSWSKCSYQSFQFIHDVYKFNQ